MADIITAISDSVESIGLAQSLIVLAIVGLGWYVWHIKTKESKSDKTTIEKQNQQLEHANEIMKTAILENRDMSEKQLIAINSLITKLDTLDKLSSYLLKEKLNSNSKDVYTAYEEAE
jgi:hypothetical protein